MSNSQARTFDDTWAVLEQSDPNAMYAMGFSAVLLQRKDAVGNAIGEKVLAIAGTDPASGQDLLSGFINIINLGTVAGMWQYEALENFYYHLCATGKIGVVEQVTVSGHSLGGFLAQAFTVRHPEAVSAAYTYNAPGFGDIESMLRFMGVTSSSAQAKITNVVATDGLDFTVALGTHKLGATVGVRIEASANPADNHLVVRLGDALAVQSVYAALQLSPSMSQIEAQFMAAGLGDRRLEDALDALRTTFIGSASNDANKTPTGDRERFYSNLYALQNDRGYNSLSGQVRLVQANAGFASLARADTNTALAYRYSLLELLPFAVVANAEAQNQTLYGYYTQRLSLYDEATGQGELTKQWLADRAAMAGALVLRNQQNVQDDVGAGGGMRPVQYTDTKSGIAFQIGLADLLSDKPQIRFGDDTAETLIGKSLVDHLYGGAGDDTLNGLSGNDWLEGNAGDDTLDGGEGADTLLGDVGTDTLDGGLGNDTLLGGTDFDIYNFSGQFGNDFIEDVGGQGQIKVGGTTLDVTAATKVSATADTWRTDDKRFTYTLINVGTAAAPRQNLIINVAAGANAGTITIRNWSNGQLGINLGPEVIVPQTSATYAGDFIKQTSGTSYFHDAHGYLNAGSSPNAADVLLGVAADETISGLGGNDGIAGSGGADVIEGGDGSDVLLGGTGADTINGGAGADFIYGSAVGLIDVPLSTTFSPPVANGVELARGFSWVAYRAPGERFVGNDAVLRNVQVAGAGLGVAYVDNGQTVVEGTGNLIDGGAGADYIAAGTGADIVHGGSEDDDIVGMYGADVLFGDDGADFIWGDGSAALASSDQPTYTPASEHGNDLIVGGAGNDVLVGQGGDDELYGGTEDDWSWGDDANAADTPVVIHGDDYLDGGDGADRLTGGGRDDVLFGGNGNDVMWGDDSDRVVPLEYQGMDYLDGGDGNDQIVGGGNDDVLIGGAGDDVMLGDDVQSEVAVSAHGDDFMDGGDGNDVMAGGGGNDEMFGGAGNDQLQGDDLGSNVDGSAHGRDWLEGGLGDDALFGGGNDDTLFGDDGDDILHGDDITSALALQFHGADYLDGGAGSDLLYGDGGDDQLFGGDGSDYLDGGDGADVLDGGLGSDAMFGGAGNDTLISDGNDYLDGGVGDDTYVLSLDPASGSAPVIADGEGTNMIEFAQGLGDPGSMQLFSQGGQAYLKVGGLGIVALGSLTRLNDTQVHAGGVATSLQQVATNNDASGRIHSAYLTADGLVSTATATFAQALSGTAFADALDGGSGGNFMDGAAGDDALSGGAGNDVLFGGAGADLVAGGTGDDEMFDGDANGAADDATDTYLFDLGDGHDRVLGPDSGADGVARDVIRFGAGITAADLQFASAQGGPASNNADLVIAYSADDTVTLAPGAFNELREIQFDDGSLLTHAQIVALLGAQAPAGDGTLQGTDSGNTLIGGAGNDRLLGHGGDDVLIGGTGRDMLIGGLGTNTYVFGADSGVDVVGPGTNLWSLQYGPPFDPMDPTVNEQAILQFSDASLAQLTAMLDGSDLVIGQPSGAAVRVLDYSRSPTHATWRIVDAAGTQVSLGDWLGSQAPTPPATLADRLQAFIDTQLNELLTTSQRPLGGAGGFDGGVPNYETSSVPIAVNQYGQWAAPGATLRLDSYLDVQNIDTVTTRYFTQPVYADATTTTPAAPETFLSVESLGNRSIPAGAVPVFGPGASQGQGTGSGQVLVGWWLPATSASTSTSQRVVGWSTVEQQTVETMASDTAFQAFVNGRDGDDVIVAAASGSAYPALFRGTIDTGTGNDVVALGNGTLSELPSAWSRFQDWIGVAAGFNSGNSNWYQRGLGAWIDTGAGDDIVAGSDGNDFIIGGTGNDRLDGQAGADTYYIERDAGSIDHISDLAWNELRWRDFGMGNDTPSSAVDAPNQDTVEFGASIGASDLTYRWTTTALSDAGAPTTSVQTLELYDAGQHFLDIDYFDASINAGSYSTAGIERFLFADGSSMSLGGLLGTISQYQDNHAPQIAAALPDQSAAQGVAFDYVVAPNAFTDADGDALSYGASMVDGSALPGWLTFDPASRAFTGTPTQPGNISVRVTATDGSLSASDDFDIAIAAQGLTLVGTPRADILRGGSGNDSLGGLGGSDILIGAGGNDTLDGGGGIDVMYGGTGDDTYIVNNSADQAIELANQGADKVLSSVSFALAANLEDLTLTGAAAINGTGNALANTLTGNSANNVLSGLGGNDIYIGGAGNDTLTDNSATSNDVYRWGIGQGNDTIRDAGGSDRIEIAAGVTADQVTLTRNGNNLNVGITGASDVLTIANWYVGTANKIEEIRLADGSSIGSGMAPLSLSGLTVTSGRMQILTDPTSSVVARSANSTLSNANLLVQAMAQFNAHVSADPPLRPVMQYEHGPSLLMPS